MKNTILYFVLFILFQSHAQSISLKNLIRIESNEQRLKKPVVFTQSLKDGHIIDVQKTN